MKSASVPMPAGSRGLLTAARRRPSIHAQAVATADPGIAEVTRCRSWSAARFVELVLSVHQYANKYWLLFEIGGAAGRSPRG